MARRFVILLFSLLLAACAQPASTQGPWQNFSDAWRLSNGKVEVVVAPSVGRIMYFGPAGGRNLLWAQPDAARHNKKYVEFDNYGGEKIWLWPQQTWPPAGECIQYHAVFTGDTLTLTSDVIPPYQVRLIRQIALHPYKPQMTVVTRLAPAMPGKPSTPPKVALWSVAQLHLPERVDAQLRSDAKPPFVSDLGTLPAWPIARQDDRTITFIRDPKLEAKSGMESSTLTAVYADMALAFRAHGSTPGPYDPYTRAQLYVQADTFNTHPPQLPPYAEIEFLSPWPTDAHPWPTLTVRWSLEKP